MTPFAYARAASADDAVRQAGSVDAKYLGGGTNLIDLMRETIERPTSLIDVTRLSREITETADGGLIIGAAARNTACGSSVLPVAAAQPQQQNAGRSRLPPAVNTLAREVSWASSARPSSPAAWAETKSAMVPPTTSRKAEERGSRASKVTTVRA